MARQRFSITEYEPPIALGAEISRATGLPLHKVTDYLKNAGDRVAHALNFSTNPLPLVGQRVRAVNFAGLLQAGPGFELEVVPKFLGNCTVGWREDFFFLAMLSRHGRLLSQERLRALSTANADLTTLVGRALVQMFWDQHRRPIRTYRRANEQHFAIEGEFEAEDLMMPQADGFPQKTIRFDRKTVFNSAIKHAASALIPLVKDMETRASLQRIVHLLGAQSLGKFLKTARIPSRSRSWQPTYDLAVDILRGFGLTFGSGQALAPGFLLSTWQVWEDLATISLRAQLGGQAVAAQRGYELGHRQRQAGEVWGNRRAFAVTPDLAVDGAKAGFGKLLVDAKYKGRLHQGRQRIDEADIYEAMAFARAAHADKIVLMYPKIAIGPQKETGNTEVFERVEIEGLEIWGVESETRGVSQTSGLRKFSEGLISGLRAVSA